MKKYLLIVVFLFILGCDGTTKFSINNMTKAKMNAACKDHGYAYSFVTSSDSVTCKDGFTTTWRDKHGEDVLIEIKKLEEQDKIESDRYLGKLPKTVQDNYKERQ